MLGTGSPAKTLDLIIEALATSDATAEVQSWGCGVLRERCGTGSGPAQASVKAKIVALGGVEAVLRALEGHLTSEAVQESACAALGNFAFDDPTIARRIVVAGGVRAVLAALQGHPKVEELQGWAFFCLRNLAVAAPACQAELLAGDAVRLVLLGIGSYPKAKKVQGCGCAVLGILAGASAEVRAQIAALGGVDLILDGLQKHPDVVKVQGCGWAALGNLFSDNADTRKRFASLGGIDLVIGALKAHISDSEVQISGLGALRNFVRDVDSIDAVVAAGGVEVVASAVHAHMELDQAQLLGMTTLQAVVADGVSCRRRNQGSVVSCAGVELAIKAMATHHSSPKLHEMTCDLLRCVVAEGFATGQKQLVAVNGMEALLCSMRGQPLLAPLQLSCCLALENVAAVDANNRERIFAFPSSPEILLEALRNHIEHAMIQATACNLIRSLARDSPERRRILVTLSAVDRASAAVAGHIDNVQVQEAGWSALSCLCREEENGASARLLDFGGVALAAAAMRCHQASVMVQKRCSTIIRRLAAGCGAHDLAEFMEAGCGSALLEALQRQRGEPEVVSRACAALHDLAGGPGRKQQTSAKAVAHARYVSELATADNVECILVCLDEHLDNPEVIKCGLDALLSLHGFPAFVPLYAGSDVLKLLMRILGVHLSTRADVVARACALLMQLCGDGETNCHRVVEISGEVIVAHALTQYPEDVAIQTSCLRTWRGLFVHGLPPPPPVVPRPPPRPGDSPRTATASAAPELSLAERIQRLEGIELLIKAVSTHTHAADVQACGCSLMASMSLADIDYRASVTAHGGLALVKQTLETHPNDRDVQACALAAWEAMSSDVSCKDQRSVIAAWGGLELVLDAMRRHPRLEVQAPACKVVCCLLSDGRPDLAAQLKGGLDLVLAAMEMQHEHEAVQQDGLYILAASTESSAACRRLVELGGVERTMHVMQTFLDSPFVQEQGCLIVQNLSKDSPDNRTLLGDKGAFDWLVAALKTHRKKKAVQERACAAMDQLCHMHNENLARAIENNVLKYLIIALQEHVAVEEIQERALSALWHIANEDPAAADLLGKQGGGQLILGALMKFPKAVKLQYCGMAALMTVATASEARRDRIVLQKGLEIVLRSLKRHLAHQVATAYGCAALYSLVKGSEANASTLFELGAFKVAKASLVAHRAVEQVQLFAGLLVGALAKVKPADYESEDDNSDAEEGEGDED